KAHSACLGGADMCIRYRPKDDSKEVCDILETPWVYTVSREGRLVHTDEIRQTQEQEPHFIIQFKKGDKICLGGQEVVIPCSNRLILTKITVNEFVPFSKPYFQWIEQNARKVSSNVLSSFNALLDPELLKERLGYTKQHIEKYRKNNPEGIVFFEDAHFHSIDVKKLCLETVGESVDILSMNEEELNHTLNEMYHLDVHVDDILSCVEGAKSIRSMFGVRRGVIIHTKDYSMYVGEPLKADIEKGLIYGNLLATAKAKHGWYGTKEQIKEVLEFGFSDRGVKNFQAVQESKYAGEAVLVPSKYIDKPRYTIGLGDSFVGGVQMCF
ncbi:MAG: ADP-dependent glucokinase/phosphofructokinase, partial [Schaedlerella arabinosiphila]|nr:ADP-dependent glucokinase/phosphofructokinase [Schaedlerella arabinosiphila]